jgi:hypothetical protein
MSTATMENLSVSQTTKGAFTHVAEISVRWGRGADTTVLASRHVSPGARFVLGEGGDVALPSELLRTLAHDVLAWSGGDAQLIVPEGAQVFVDALPHSGGVIPLRPGHVVDAILGDFVIRATMVTPAERIRAGFSLGATALPTIGVSALVHGLLVASVAFFMPQLSEADEEEASRDRIYAMQKTMNAIAEREREEEQRAQLAPGASQGDSGQAAKGESGAMGRPDVPASKQGRWSAAGHAPRAEVTLPRERELALASSFGMIGLLGASSLSDPNAPVVPWGAVLSGSDPSSHAGNLWGSDVGDAFGGGLGLSGTGEGGGGPGEGIGIDRVGTVGHLGSGTCTVAGPCMGHGAHGGGAGHKVRSPVFRHPVDLKTNGRLPAEVIQRTVRLNAGRYRACYESGLRTNPSLAGRVEVHFVIARDGSVSLAQDGAGSDLPDASVRACVVKTFYGLSFPAPEGGTVNVTYPLVLSPE